VRAEFINPFLHAANEVLQSELGSSPRRGQVGLQKSAYTTDDVTAVVGVTGAVAGVVLYAMTEATARAIVSKMMGQEFRKFDALAQSGIGEIGNVITGRAAVLLAEAGYPSDLAPPMLIVGRGTLVTTLDMQRLVIPLETEFGKIEIQVALRLTQAQARTRVA
jgi:chemotaxis protein CheX